MTDTPTGAPPDSPTGATKPTTDRTLVVVLIIIAVLVVAALVAVFARGAAPQHDANSPEGGMQRYVSAVVANDPQTARALHASNLSTGCEPVSAFVSSDTRVTLVDTTEHADFATVTVSIDDGYGGPFGGSSGYQDQFELVPSGESWLVSYAPWLFQVCIDEVVR